MIKNKDIKTVIPPLRFPEFRDAEGWYIESLSSIGDCAGGLSGKSSADFGSGEPYVTYKQIFNSSVLDIAKCESVAIGENEKQTKLQYGDVLITMSSETPEDIGYSSIVVEHLTKPVYLNSFCFLFRPNKLQYPLPEFSRYLFHSPVYRKSISALAQGITRYNISKGKFLNLSLPIPDREKEQQKISTCFGSLDDLISAVADKIEVLKLHKKGLMQQLFPAEGKTTPTLRFPEFQNVGEWKLSSIKKCNIDAFTGYAFKGNEILEDCDGTPLMRGINITEGVVRHNNDIDRFYNGEDYTLGKYRLLCNDLVIAMDGSKVGRNFALINKQDEGSLLVQRVARLRSNSADFIMFLYQQIGSDRFKTYVDRINTSSGIPHISLKQIEDFEIWTPRNDKEIKMVTNCLSSIDELISAEIDKLDQLKAHKKGLMQQLFPIINE